jgi:hypothetical protein
MQMALHGLWIQSDDRWLVKGIFIVSDDKHAGAEMADVQSDPRSLHRNIKDLNAPNTFAGRDVRSQGRVPLENDGYCRRVAAATCRDMLKNLPYTLAGGVSRSLVQARWSSFQRPR